MRTKRQCKARCHWEDDHHDAAMEPTRCLLPSKHRGYHSATHPKNKEKFFWTRLRGS